MKLIDILNMISKGELKEGTRVVCNGNTFTYRKLREDSGRNTLDLYSAKNNTLINATYLTPVLNFEVELIEPGHFTDVGKMAEKIKELDKDSCGVINEYNSQGEVYARSFNVGAFRNEIIDKLNEVISVLNRRNEDVR